MTATTSYDLPGLATELKRQLETRDDVVADTRVLSLATSPYHPEVTPEPLRLTLDRRGEPSADWAITDHAHGQIRSYLQCDAKLYKRLRADHPDLLAHLANGLFTREPAKRLVRVMDGTVRAFMSNTYRPRDNWDLLDQAILPTLGEYMRTGARVEFKACELTETHMYIKTVFPDIYRPVGDPQVGDTVRAGLIVKNSEVGSSSLGIFPYTDRLICRNGMVHTDYGKAARHVGKRITGEEESWDFWSDETRKLDEQAFFAKCADTVRGVLNETVFDAIVAQMDDLASMRLPESPLDTVKNVTKRHDFSEGESNSILTALIENADLTGWGLVNAITQTARDLDSPDRRVDLETLAGKMTADPALLAAA